MKPLVYSLSRPCQQCTMKTVPTINYDYFKTLAKTGEPFILYHETLIYLDLHVFYQDAGLFRLIFGEPIRNIWRENSPNLRFLINHLICRPGEIVSFDRVFEDAIFSCQPDEGQCPGLGGVVVGCDSTPPLPPVQMPECNMTQNPYGECGCSQQVR